MTGIPESQAAIHRMIPGTHEWPRTPECRCGKPWDYWDDQCSTATDRAIHQLPGDDE